MAGNRTLHKAKKERNDEFYTQLSDIEKELFHYKDHFRGKTILCNCDDPRVSNFFHYFFMNFKFFGLKKLIATCYKNQEWNLFSEGNSEKAVYIVYEGPKEGDEDPMPKDTDIKVRELEGDGDFRSAECKAFLEAADIVVTNPPFSLFRDFVSLMMEYEKKFIVIGNMNAITYKEIFPLIKDKKMWVGIQNFTGDRWFIVPDDYEGKYTKVIDGKKYAPIKSIWYTNLEHNHKKEPVILVDKYSPEKYPKFDNYDAINVDKVTDIPVDYYGVMGVPISFLDKWNPFSTKPKDYPDDIITTDDFEIVELRKGVDGRDLPYSINMLNKDILRNTKPSTSISGMIKNTEGKINNKTTYARILIMRKR